MVEILFPIKTVYCSGAYIESSRSGRLAIFQILAHWWINGCTALPDDPILEQIAGLRSVEWLRDKIAIKTALSVLMPVLQAKYDYESKKAKKRQHNAILASQASLKSYKRRANQIGKEKPHLTDKGNTRAGFSATPPPHCGYNQDMSDQGARTAAHTTMASRTGEKVWLNDKAMFKDKPTR